MRGELGAPSASRSISIGGHRTELQPQQDWVSESEHKLTGRIYLGEASSVWKVAQQPVEMHDARKGSQGTLKGVVGKRLITIVVTIGSIDGKESCNAS